MTTQESPEVLFESVKLEAVAFVMGFLKVLKDYKPEQLPHDPMMLLFIQTIEIIKYSAREGTELKFIDDIVIYLNSKIKEVTDF